MTPTMKPVSRGLLAAILLSSALSAQADELFDDFGQRFQNLGFHLGTLTEFYDAVQVDDSGGQDKFALNPLLGFSTDFELTPTWALVPEINWVLPRQVTEGTTKNLIMVRLDGAWRGGDWWRLRAGTSLMINNIRGDGGSTRMNNGGSTSEFYLPSESKTAVNNTLDFGAEAFKDAFALRFQSYIYALARSERRQVSYTLTLSYYYDLGE